MANITSITELIRGFIKDQQKIDGRNIFSYDTDNKFTLSEDYPLESSIKVYLNDELMNTVDWSYNSDTNQVIIDPLTSGVILNQGDSIIIVYSYYKKYSDDEIKGYIKSSLIWFTVYRYKKIFQIDDDDVVAINDVNPTTEEQYLIALITATEIDPNNARLSTPDFSYTGEENKSKKEQIGDIFRNWQRFVGNIEWLEDEC